MDKKEQVAEYLFNGVMLDSRFPGYHGIPFSQIPEKHPQKQEAYKYAKDICQLDTEPCPECGGDGKRHWYDQNDSGNYIGDDPCLTCKGTGRKPTTVKVRTRHKKYTYSIMTLSGLAKEDTYRKGWDNCLKLIRQLNPSVTFEEVSPH